MSQNPHRREITLLSGTVEKGDVELSLLKIADPHVPSLETLSRRIPGDKDLRDPRKIVAFLTRIGRGQFWKGCNLNRAMSM